MGRSDGIPAGFRPAKRRSSNPYPFPFWFTTRAHDTILIITVNRKIKAGKKDGIKMYRIYTTGVDDEKSRHIDVQGIASNASSSEPAEYFCDDSDSAMHVMRRLIERVPRSRIRLTDSDGWECDEADILGSQYVSHVFTNRREDLRYRMPAKTPIALPRLLLASNSPRRREYLRYTGIPFDAVAADVDEQRIAQETEALYRDEPFGVRAACTVMALAEAKATAVGGDTENGVVLGSDTVVTIDDEVLGKPDTEAFALEMIRRLSGRDHHVYTGVSIAATGRIITFYTSARVRFHPWTEVQEETARRYVDSKAPLDKAGAYGIQDQGALLIQEIRGDFYTIAGLPLSTVYLRLKEIGF